LIVNATKVIKDGDLLEIDGSSGIVRGKERSLIKKQRKGKDKSKRSTTTHLCLIH
jgi:hypothetical protein